MPEKKQLNSNDILKNTKTLSIVSKIWGDILQQDKINPDDNFFELGGDSLMIMMLLFQVNDNLHVELHPGAVMDAPTLLEFCEMIDSQMDTVDPGDLTDDIFKFTDVECGVI